MSNEHPLPPLSHIVGGFLGSHLVLVASTLGAATLGATVGGAKGGVVAAVAVPVAVLLKKAARCMMNRCDRQNAYLVAEDHFDTLLRNESYAQGLSQEQIEGFKAAEQAAYRAYKLPGNKGTITFIEAHANKIANGFLLDELSDAQTIPKTMHTYISDRTPSRHLGLKTARLTMSPSGMK